MPTCPLVSSARLPGSTNRIESRDSHLKPRTIFSTLVLMLVVSLTAGSLRADWLILVDGQRVETRGPWKVDSGRVLYTSASGALTALRLENVDLDASAKANLPPTAPKPTARREPAVVLNQSDVATVSRSVRDAAAEQVAANVAGNPADETAATDTSSLSVSEWSEVDFETGTKLAGTIRNDDVRSHIGAKLEVFLRDEAGEVLATAIASLGTRNLQSGDTTSFEAVFPNVFSYREATFQLGSVPLRSNSRDSGSPTASPSDDPSAESPSDESSLEEIQR